MIAIKTLAFTSVLCTLFLGASASARAEAEFCGAELRELTPVAAPSVSSGAVYAFVLRALTERSVQGEIVAETDRGWFSWQFPKTKLNLVADHLKVHGFDIQGKDFESDPLYVAFPGGAVVKHAWIEHAQTYGETELGWDSRGQATCEVPDFGDADPRGLLTLPSAPPASASITIAQPTDARFSPTCAKPFMATQVADVPHLVIPQDFSGPMNGSSVAAVAIGSDGTVLDAWLLGSSGNTRWDNEVRIAAHQAKYTPGTSYCMPANTIYYFTAAFRQ